MQPHPVNNHDAERILAEAVNQMQRRNEVELRQHLMRMNLGSHGRSEEEEVRRTPQGTRKVPEVPPGRFEPTGSTPSKAVDKSIKRIAGHGPTRPLKEQPSSCLAATSKARSRAHSAASSAAPAARHPRDDDSDGARHARKRKMKEAPSWKDGKQLRANSPRTLKCNIDSYFRQYKQLTKEARTILEDLTGPNVAEAMRLMRDFVRSYHETEQMADDGRQDLKGLWIAFQSLQATGSIEPTVEQVAAFFATTPPGDSSGNGGTTPADTPGGTPRPRQRPTRK